MLKIRAKTKVCICCERKSTFSRDRGGTCFLLLFSVLIVMTSCSSVLHQDQDESEDTEFGTEVYSDLDSETSQNDEDTDAHIDKCPYDDQKTLPGLCGCGVSDVDRDSDGYPDCYDNCPADPNKTEPGACNCGVADVDRDGDGHPDCNEYVEGLKRTHRLDSDKDGVFETEVCQELADLWSEDSHLSIATRGFGFSYKEGITPCKEIGPFDKWISVFEGFLYLSTSDGAVHNVGFNADVNDGVRFILMDSWGRVEICKMELWRDVPEYSNYHSTDEYAADYGCETDLTPGVYYPMKLEVYHESDPDSSNDIFNRAYLSMFYRGVPTGGSIEFYRAAK